MFAAFPKWKRFPFPAQAFVRKFFFRPRPGTLETSCRLLGNLSANWLTRANWVAPFPSLSLLGESTCGPRASCFPGGGEPRRKIPELFPEIFRTSSCRENSRHPNGEKAGSCIQVANLPLAIKKFLVYSIHASANGNHEQDKEKLSLDGSRFRLSVRPVFGNSRLSSRPQGPERSQGVSSAHRLASQECLYDSQGPARPHGSGRPQGPLRQTRSPCSRSPYRQASHPGEYSPPGQERALRRSHPQTSSGTLGAPRAGRPCFNAPSLKFAPCPPAVVSYRNHLPFRRAFDGLPMSEHMLFWATSGRCNIPWNLASNSS